MGSEVALFCTVHPTSAASEKRVLDLLRKSAREYYCQPRAKCTTWTYYTPFPAPKPTAKVDPIVGGLEIYTDKSALSTQQNDPAFFHAYHDTVKKEGLYAKDEELVAWYQSVGFLARNEFATPYGNALISISKFVCRDRHRVIETIRQFSQWVDQKEPGVLTYVGFTRPKAPNELLLFVRYKDVAALRAHSTAPEHDDVVKKMSPYIENNPADSTTLWQEVKDSFVSTRPGGGQDSSSKL